MKRRFRAAVLLLVLTVLLTTVVFADSGPKPQMAVRVVHAPQEAYYLDLLDANLMGPSGVQPDSDKRFHCFTLPVSDVFTRTRLAPRPCSYGMY